MAYRGLGLTQEFTESRYVQLSLLGQSHQDFQAGFIAELLENAAEAAKRSSRNLDLDGFSGERVRFFRRALVSARFDAAGRIDVQSGVSCAGASPERSPQSGEEAILGPFAVALPVAGYQT